MAQQTGTTGRTPLNRDRVLGAAVALADGIGIEALSMRRLAQELGVVPMALYKHVANKDQLLDGMLDLIVGAIVPPAPGTDWRSAVRQRVLAARSALLGHPWAAQVLQSRARPTPAVLAHTDAVIGIFRSGGFSVDLTHHVMHALGSRLLGFTQELFDDSAGPATPPALPPAALRELAARYPYVAELAAGATHDQGSVVGRGCDDQFEFEFALDLLLDGFDRLHRQGWTSGG
ncbi:TetR/AcrR family transcriptional regulator C-terminal domain-containing protein [Kitasatospora sp. NPDC002040]|uniref:TetR/AcrR family transcriptional regulator C-terminal domain-containing protein n=1 Tax=Kitasatospora sp. NPDC002040 TaxID=3154661 RepID=UPI0033269FE5